MSAKLESFHPLVPAADDSAVRIVHVYTNRSTVEPLPYLVDAQRRSDRRQGRNTWVLVGSETEEALLCMQLNSMLAIRAQEEGTNNTNYESHWSVRCTKDIKDLSPEDDCVFITTTENALIHLIAAEGATPKHFSDKMTFMLDQGWGNLTMKAAYAYDRLVRFAFANRKTTSHIICTISSDVIGPFNRDWVASQQDCRMIIGDETPRSITFWENTREPLLAMDDILKDLQLRKAGRAILLMEHSDALELETVGHDLEKHCHLLSASDGPEKTWEKLSDTSKHVIANSKELTYLGNIPDATHVVLYPLREGSVWDSVTNQVAVDAGGLECPMAELRYAMSWRSSGKGPEIHYLGPRALYDNLEEEPVDSMVYTSHFDNHVLSSLSVWPQLAVAELPLRVGRNPDLIEERLRRLMYKGLLEFDDARDPKPQRRGPRYHSFLKLTHLGCVVSELVNPYNTAIESAHAACLIGQLFLKIQSATAAMKDAVCSLAVVLTSNGSFTYIDSIIKPMENFKQYNDNEDSLASELCHRGPIWLATCVWHFTLVDKFWKVTTSPMRRMLGIMTQSTEVNSHSVVLWHKDTFEWEKSAGKVKRFFDSCGEELKYAGMGHKLSTRELLEVEVMLVTAFMDKLAFVYVPATDGAFGFSLTTGKELSRPTDEQMRLIHLNKCWEEDKAAVGRETPGIYCIFTHCRMYDVDGRAIARPYDLTYVSSAAVRRAMIRVHAPATASDVFNEIESTSNLEQ